MRVVAVALLLVFGFGTTHAGTLLTPACAGCPADCPMHARGRRCHEGGGVPASAKSAHCHQRAQHGPGLRAGGCTSHPDGITVLDQPALLPADAGVPFRPPLTAVLTITCQRPSAITLDPPFHPPRSPLRLAF